MPLAPTNPAAARCVVEVDAKGRAQVTLDRRRRVLGALLGMIGAGRVGPGLEVADESVELLALKYRDPVGAAFGALTLHRLGKRGSRAAWVENLARDFAWLPDGRILLAALLAAQGPREQRRGLDLLLACAAGPVPIFADALSLAMSLLRKWPGGARPAERDAARARLAPLSSRLDLDSIYSLVRKT